MNSSVVCFACHHGFWKKESSASLPMLTAAMLRPPPALQEVHLWCMFPEEVDSSLLRRYQKFLCPEEQADLCKARTQKMQTARLLARTLVRTTLARYADGQVDPSSLRFRKNMFGKPQVMWPKLSREGELWMPPRLCFNLSHTESLIAFGVTVNSAVGIDVEEKHRKPASNLMRLARSKFSSMEADWLQQFTDSEEQCQQFMRLWTLKEAYVKAVGKGISGVPFKQFSFHLKASPIAEKILREITHLPTDPQAKSITLELSGGVAERERPSSTWKFVLLQPSPVHVASVCVEDQQHADISLLTGAADCNDGRKQCTFQTWKTVPLVSDEFLSEGALGLGVSN